MVSWGELLLTVTAASYLLGRKELPKLGRFVGLYTGRSMGAIIRAKQEFFDATKDHEIVKLQREFQRGIEELNEIRAELTTVGNMARPHQPVGTAVTVGPTAAPATSAAPSTPSFVANQASTLTRPPTAVASSSVSVQPNATPAAAAIRPTVATSEYIATLSGRQEKRTDEASLALAELKLAERGSYATRIESLEGGADYVAASIVDSLLLDRLDRQNASQPGRDPHKQ
ncbi:hypothetical protein ATCC90586_002814 [Pythium insidiosum]|nr:hypothetical protein ATCC90586_002814 [Pythium insidiosum]